MAMLQGKTDKAVETLKVPNLVGELMDVDVPLYQIEQERRHLLNTGNTDHLLWLSLLVCAAYEDVKSFKDNMVELLEKDLQSLGKPGEAGKLGALCKYSISPYTLFKISVCLIDTASFRGMLWDKIREFTDTYSIRQDVLVISRFRLMIGHARHYGLVVVGLVISAMIWWNGSSSMPLVQYTGLLVMISTILLMFFIMKRILTSKSLSCADIEMDIRSDIPGIRAR